MPIRVQRCVGRRLLLVEGIVISWHNCGHISGIAEVNLMDFSTMKGLIDETARELEASD
jgi:hypothetical protein